MSTIVESVPVRALLRSAGEVLPDATREQVLALGLAAVPALLEAVFDDSVLDLDEEGWAPYHAVDLLGALRAADTVPALLRRVVAARTDGCDIDVPVLEAIARMRPAAHPHLLAALDDPTLALAHGFARDCLVTQGVHDDRTLELLLRACDEDWDQGPELLAEHGDPRAVPHLMRALVRERAQHMHRRRGLTLTPFASELVRAIRALGGQPPADYAALYDAQERLLDE